MDYRIKSSCACALLILLGWARAAQAIPIPVNYQGTSWVTDGVTIALATPLTGDNAVQNITSSRVPVQTFTTTDAFTLDKIWIKYKSLEAGSDNYTMEVRLYEIDNPNVTNLPVPLTNLFSEAQMHAVPQSASNNASGNYAVFDVENVALDANRGYGFGFIVTGSNNAGSAYKWMGFTNNVYPGGSYYRLEQSPDNLNIDLVWALEPLVITTPPPDPDPPLPVVESPEPATALMCGLAMLMMGGRPRRVVAVTA